jgi:hypothetical protein
MYGLRLINNNYVANGTGKVRGVGVWSRRHLSPNFIGIHDIITHIKLANMVHMVHVTKK